MFTRHDSNASLVTSARRMSLEVYDFITGIANVGPDVDRAYVSGFSFVLKSAGPGKATLFLVLTRVNPETHEQFPTDVTAELDVPTVERILAFFDVTEKNIVKLVFKVSHSQIAELSVTTYLSHKE